MAVVCTRWRIEEDIRAAKSPIGLEHGQVTCWNSWMRWSLISLLAAALLAVALARTVLRAPSRDLAHTLHWSRWRRRHQYRPQPAMARSGYVQRGR